MFDFQCWSDDPPIDVQGADLSRRCPLWEKCGVSQQGPRSTRHVFISDYRDQVVAAQQYNQTDDFLYEMKTRSKIARIVFELTHYNGARRCGKGGVDATAACGLAVQDVCDCLQHQALDAAVVLACAAEEGARLLISYLSGV